jgi:hypothetical protein
LGTAVTLAVMGRRFRVMTRKLSEFKMPELPAAGNEAELPAEMGKRT